MADTKSVATFSIGTYGDSSMDSSSIGGSSTKSRSEARRARHMAKLKRRMENMPTRKLLFRPRIYEHWREGDQEDEVAERERLLKDIAAKEQRLLEQRKLKEGDGEGGGHSDSSEENEYIKALERLKSRREREEDYKTKLELDKKRREEEEAMEHEEKLLSELQNPSVYGWFYTDGYYDTAPYFGVREDMVTKFAQEQEEWREKWSKRYPETFTDKFKRFFWPPNLMCKGYAFRTRGSYLDFPEVISDWPKLTTEVNFERDPREYITNRHELFGADKAQAEEDEKELEEARLLAEMEAAETGEEVNAELVEQKLASIKLGLKPKGLDIDLEYSAKDVDAHHYYYDDDEGEFYRKRLGFEGEYYFDGTCWRHKRKRGKYKFENQQTPYDFFFDDTTREFKPREEFKGLNEAVYDPKSCVYRIHQILTTTPIKTEKKTKSGKTVLDVPEFKDDPTSDDGEGRKKYKPTSYYFDEEFGKWILRSRIPENITTTDITWDDNGNRYTRKFEGPWRGLTGLSSDDYYFVDRDTRFLPKPARQPENFKYYPSDGVWRKSSDIKPNTLTRSEDVARFYFDDFEGQFKLKDLTEGSNVRYLQGKYSRIWHKVPKPKSGLYPSDYYWDSTKKRWLPRSVRMEMLRNAEVARQKKILSGQQAANMWDIKQETNMTKDDYYFDFEEGAYLKKHPNEEYVISEAEHCWTLVSLKDKPRQTRFHHEYYFDLKENSFFLKDGNLTYEYDQTYHVWKKANDDISKAEVDKWYYDLHKEAWFEKGGASGVRYDPMLNINVIPHNEVNFKSPDDFFFNIPEGRFSPKEGDLAMAGYYVYDSGDGAWKMKDAKGRAPNNLTPRSFFFDDFGQCFKLRISGRDKDYWYDTRNKIYRQISASGKSKSGYRPNDFIWNTEFKTFIPLAILKKGRVDVTNELPVWDPLRTYEKPWMSAVPLRNPDATKTDERRQSMVSNKTGTGWFGSGGAKPSNKVAPATSTENKDLKKK